MKIRGTGVSSSKVRKEIDFYLVRKIVKKTAKWRRDDSSISQKYDVFVFISNMVYVLICRYCLEMHRYQSCEDDKEIVYRKISTAKLLLKVKLQKDLSNLEYWRKKAENTSKCIKYLIE